VTCSSDENGASTTSKTNKSSRTHAHKTRGRTKQGAVYTKKKSA
jgi:hypothetical protein